MKMILLILFLSLSFANICQAGDRASRILVHKSGKSLSFILNHKRLTDLSVLWIEMSKSDIHQDEDVDVYFDEDISFRDFENLKGFFDAYGINNVKFYCVNWETKKMSSIVERWTVSNIPSDLDADMKH